MLVRLDPVRSADPPMISGMMAANTFNTSSDLMHEGEGREGEKGRKGER